MGIDPILSGQTQRRFPGQVCYQQRQEGEGCKGDLTYTAGLRGRGHGQGMQQSPEAGMVLSWQTEKTQDQSLPTARNLTCM